MCRATYVVLGGKTIFRKRLELKEKMQKNKRNAVKQLFAETFNVFRSEIFINIGLFYMYIRSTQESSCYIKIQAH